MELSFAYVDKTTAFSKLEQLFVSLVSHTGFGKPFIWQNGVSIPFESACSPHAWCGHVLGSVSGCRAGDMCGCLLGDAIHFNQILQVERDNAFTIPCSFGCGFGIVYARSAAFVLTPSLRGDIAISHSEIPRQVLKEIFGLRNYPRFSEKWIMNNSWFPHWMSKVPLISYQHNTLLVWIKEKVCLPEWGDYAGSVSYSWRMSLSLGADVMLVCQPRLA